LMRFRLGPYCKSRKNVKNDLMEQLTVT
jgi:hypothetical protein